MKTGFLTPEYPGEKSIGGGLASYIEKTARQLAEKEHEVLVFVQSDRDFKRADSGVAVVEIKFPGPVKAPWDSLISVLAPLRALYPYVREFVYLRRVCKAVWREHGTGPFDVVQASSYRAPGLFLTGNGRFPLICRISSYSPLLISISRGRMRLFSRFACLLELMQARRSDAVFAPSEFMAEYFSKFLPEKACVIRTPVDEAPGDIDCGFYRKNLAGKKYLLYFGTLNRVKGADLIAPAAPAVSEKHPGTLFVFIGRDGGMPDGEKVFDYIRRYPGVEEGMVEYYPAIPRKQLYPAIKNASAVIIPSRADNYPNACIEAMSMGVPVIAAADSSLEEMVRDGETGFLFKNGDSGSLAAALERFLSMPGPEKEGMRRNIFSAAAAMRSEDRAGILAGYYKRVAERFRSGEKCPGD